MAEERAFDPRPSAQKKIPGNVLIRYVLPARWEDNMSVGALTILTMYGMPKESAE